MARTDVVLKPDSGEVQIECDNLWVDGHDLLLSAASRRRQGTLAMRRALVHDENDGLTLNFAGDYPGGVTVHGELALGAIKPLSRNPDDRPTKPSHLLVHGGITYEEAGINVRGEPTRVQVSVGDQLEELHRQLDALAARVQALGG